jgi:hypothetical protein
MIPYFPRMTIQAYVLATGLVMRGRMTMEVNADFLPAGNFVMR